MAPPRFASSAPALQDYSKLISWDQVPRKRMFCCRLDFSIPPHNQYLLHHLLFHRIISTPTDKQENKEIALLQLHFFPTALHNKIPFQQFQQLFSHPSFFFIPGIYLETGILLHRIFLDPPWNSATFAAGSATFPDKNNSNFGHFQHQQVWDLGMATAAVALWCPGLISPTLKGLSWEKPQNLVYSLLSLARIPPKAEQG